MASAPARPASPAPRSSSASALSAYGRRSSHCPLSVRALFPSALRWRNILDPQLQRLAQAISRQRVDDVQPLPLPHIRLPQAEGDGGPGHAAALAVPVNQLEAQVPAILAHRTALEH